MPVSVSLVRNVSGGRIEVQLALLLAGAPASLTFHYLMTPFALSLSKGMVRQEGFDKISPNGFGLS
jgi:hypothetical protein